MMSLFGWSEPLHFLHRLAFVFVLTLALLFTFSSGRRATATASPEDTGESVLDLTPWRFARITGTLISIATIACYIALAQ
jgi:SSS family solute:Na+ symporter